eukprot:gene16984-23257_t
MCWSKALPNPVRPSHSGSSGVAHGRGCSYARSSVCCHAQPKCHYSVLGVPRTASDSEIKSAFRALAKRLHPDVNKTVRISSSRQRRSTTTAYAWVNMQDDSDDEEMEVTETIFSMGGDDGKARRPIGGGGIKQTDPKGRKAQAPSSSLKRDIDGFTVGEILETLGPQQASVAQKVFGLGLEELEELDLALKVFGLGLEELEELEELDVGFVVLRSFREEELEDLRSFREEELEELEKEDMEEFEPMKDVCCYMLGRVLGLLPPLREEIEERASLALKVFGHGLEELEELDELTDLLELVGAMDGNSNISFESDSDDDDNDLDEEIEFARMRQSQPSKTGSAGCVEVRAHEAIAALQDRKRWQREYTLEYVCMRPSQPSKTGTTGRGGGRTSQAQSISWEDVLFQDYDMGRGNTAGSTRRKVPGQSGTGSRAAASGAGAAGRRAAPGPASSSGRGAQGGDRGRPGSTARPSSAPPQSSRPRPRGASSQFESFSSSSQIFRDQFIDFDSGDDSDDDEFDDMELADFLHGLQGLEMEDFEGG